MKDKIFKLEEMTHGIESPATREETAFPPKVEARLREVCSQLKQSRRGREPHKGKSLILLLTGQRTGTTMGARFIAQELAKVLCRVDLSVVVSKYIGETEKNLNRLLNAAEEASAILLFDEAEALFGRRSEVKDSHDRYANLEVNYLLERMENYKGLVILATNDDSALDEAFKRHFHYIIEWPLPDEDERRRLWTDVFPAGSG